MDKKKREDPSNACTGAVSGASGRQTAKCGCDLKAMTKKDKKNQKWVKPELTDVSGRVMAQPYIRFT